MQVFFNNAKFIESLRVELTERHPDLDTEELDIIDVNFRPSDSVRHTENAGLTIALERAKDAKRTIVLTSFLPEELLRKDFRFVGLLAYQNVGFMRTPFTADEIKELFIFLKNGGKPKNGAVEAVFTAELKDREVAVLYHDLRHALDNAMQMERWFERAEKAGFSGREEEVISAVKSWQRKAPGKFEKQSFDGVFVDLMGTLVNEDGKVNEPVLHFVRKQIATKPVTVLSDSDQKLAEEILQRLGIEFPLISKFDMKGTTLEIVIDDLTPEEFRERYGITAKAYIQTSTLI